MKKIGIGTILLIVIPYIIIIICNKEQNKFSLEQSEIVRVKRESTGIIEEIPLEQYIMGVLSGEMPVNFELEALKAQAVAARSYVLKKKEKTAQETYDVVDTVSNQVYLNDQELKEKWGKTYNEKINKIKRAVLETEGEYLTYNGQVIEAFFFSTSVGATENSGEVFQQQLPYLVSVESNWDATVSPVFQVSYNISLADFYTKLNLPYQKVVTIQITKTTSTGRVKELVINNKTFTGSQIYQTLNLKSTYFTITQTGTNIHIETKGYGHGVGMSQYGALGMAKEGYHYDQILKHYYQGTEIKKI